MNQQDQLQRFEAEWARQFGVVIDASHPGIQQVDARGVCTAGAAYAWWRLADDAAAEVIAAKDAEIAHCKESYRVLANAALDREAAFAKQDAEIVALRAKVLPVEALREGIDAINYVVSTQMGGWHSDHFELIKLEDAVNAMKALLSSQEGA